jgi:hypothetical protein
LNYYRVVQALEGFDMLYCLLLDDDVIIPTTAQLLNMTMALSFHDQSRLRSYSELRNMYTTFPVSF